MKSNYNPDVLSCLANLSNDEVFTPPTVVNKMLDMLPTELWSSSKSTFLDPVSKTGVFLREIAKRLMIGLADEIPDAQERANHIFTKQIYGIAITELTSLLSRRSLYCSKRANGALSVCTAFNYEEGNIIFTPTSHTWERGRCKFCGASQEVYDRVADLESHAYKFIHTQEPKNIFKNMKFDVIIGNPPYQMGFGIEGANSSNAKSIYNLFVSQAIKLNPRYISMITPSRWMTKTSQGIPDNWVDEMLQSHKFEIMHDFLNSNDCFPGVSIMGGVNYFLWNRDYNGKCKYYFHYSNNKEMMERFDYLDATNSGIVIRDPKSYSIIEKIVKLDGEYYNISNNNLSGLVSPKHFFDNGIMLTSNWKDYRLEKDDIYNVKYYISKSFNSTSYGWISINQMPKNTEVRKFHKVYIPAANGSNEIILGQPFYGEPNSVCSQTYLVIGYKEEHNLNEDKCENIISYIKTQFFRYLVSIKKKTQNGPRGVYQFVPMQDFTEEWTDEKLYVKYGLTDEEIAFIDSMIRPMN